MSCGYTFIYLFILPTLVHFKWSCDKYNLNTTIFIYLLQNTIIRKVV